jgi:hypothetical protein
MSVYRLDPIAHRLVDPNWQASTIKELVFASAETPDAARELVAQKTMSFSSPGKFAPKLQSPWLLGALTTCVWEPSKNDLPIGAVVRMDGSVV